MKQLSASFITDLHGKFRDIILKQHHALQNEIPHWDSKPYEIYITQLEDALRVISQLSVYETVDYSRVKLQVKKVLNESMTLLLYLKQSQDPMIVKVFVDEFVSQDMNSDVLRELPDIASKASQIAATKDMKSLFELLGRLSGQMFSEKEL